MDSVSFITLDLVNILYFMWMWTSIGNSSGFCILTLVWHHQDMICSYALVSGMHIIMLTLPYGKNSDQHFLVMLSGQSFQPKSCFAVLHSYKARLCSLGSDLLSLIFVFIL